MLLLLFLFVRSSLSVESTFVKACVIFLLLCVVCLIGASQCYVSKTCYL